MFKKATIILVVLVLILTAIPVSASSHGNGNLQKITACNNGIYAYNGVGYYCNSIKPVTFKRTFYVTERGGVFRVGFATLKFPKGFLEKERLPVKIDVEISAVNGVPGIEVAPDITEFKKGVTITLNLYNGLLYDKVLKKNILVRIRQQRFIVYHFSRYAFS